MSASHPDLLVSTDELVHRLARSPRLPRLVEQFQALLRAEAEQRRRFYDQVSEAQKAEFINGEVIVQTPVKLRHSQASENLFSLLKAYVEKHRLGYAGHEKVLVSLTRNDYEPDICYFGPEKARLFTLDQVKFPAPDLIVEVLSASTEAVDRGVKFEDYALHGVDEYWIVDPEAETIEQYLREGETYELSVKLKTGTIESAAVNGFAIPVRAVFEADEHLAALQAILR